MVTLNGSLTVADVHAVASADEPVEVELGRSAREQMAESRAAVEGIAETNEESVYGVNTGLGNLEDVSLGRADLQRQQINLLRSHHAGTGEPVSQATTRATLLVRANALAVGVSGVRPALVDRLCALLAEDVLPIIPSSGSADNACELSNVGLVLAGDPAGEALVDGDRMSAPQALAAADIDAYTFGAKEALALISGTSVMTAQTALAAAQLCHLASAVDIAGAWTFTLVGEEPGAFDARVFEAKPIDGHAETAANVRRLAGIETSERADMTQDPLSIRCIPQTNGSLREHLSLATSIIEDELASATDNPLVFPDGVARSCGNFNGQHVAGVADLLALTTRKVGRASERRTALLLSDDEFQANLAADPGLESGASRAQYAAGSLVTEAETVHTASDRSFVASDGQEDLHTAGNLASKNLARTVDLISRVVAVELLCCGRATRQCDETLPPALSPARAFLDEQGALVGGDAPWADRIERLAADVRSGTLVNAVRDRGTKLV